MSWGDGCDTQLSSTPPLSPPPLLRSRPRPLELTFALAELPMQAGKNAPPSAPSHLLFIVCFLQLLLAAAFTDIRRVGNGEIGQGRGRERVFKRECCGDRVEMKERKRGLSSLFVGNCSMSTSCQTRTKKEKSYLTTWILESLLGNSQLWFIISLIIL